MKKIVLLIAVLGFTLSAYAQDGVEIGAFTGYLTNGKVTGYNGEFKLVGGQNYGAQLSVPIAEEGMKLELSYMRADTRLEFREYYLTGSTYKTDAYTEYYQIGATSQKDLGGKIFPFGGFTLGATRFAPYGSTYSEEWAFSVTLGGGLKIYLGEKFGIRLQARALLPMKFSGIGIGFGTGGASTGVYSRAMLQGDFTAGVFLNLQK